MSAPFAGGSQPMPGQWPEPASHQSSYDPAIARAVDQRSHQIPQHSHFPAPSRQPNDQSTFQYNQTRDLAAPRGFQSSTSTTLDVNRTQALLSAGDKPETVRRPSATRTCAKCGNSLSGQFVRALDATYHLECFTCHVSIAFFLPFSYSIKC